MASPNIPRDLGLPPSADTDPAITGYQLADPSDVNHPVYLPLNAAGALFVDVTGHPYYWNPAGRLVTQPTLPRVTVGKTVPAPWAGADPAPIPPPSTPAKPAAGTTETHTIQGADQQVPVTVTHTADGVQASAPIPAEHRIRLGHVVVVIGTDLEHALARIKAFFAEHVFGHHPAAQ